MLNTFTDIEKRVLIELYLKGVTITELMKKFCTSNRHGILNYLRSQNITIRQDQKTVAKRYKLNSSIFNIIDNAEKAYWLGFMFADGYVSTDAKNIRIMLSHKDIEHLEKFKMFLESTHPIKIKANISSYKPKSLYCIYDVYSSELVNALSSIGCKQNKSLTLTFPTLSTKLISHFIRGYFDGDGSVYETKKVEDKYVWKAIGIGICGTKEFLETLALHISGLNCIPIYKEKRRDTNTWNYRLLSNKRVRLFYDYIYQDATIYLDRKKAVFDNYYERRSETIISCPQLEDKGIVRSYTKV